MPVAYFHYSKSSTFDSVSEGAEVDSAIWLTCKTLKLPTRGKLAKPESRFIMSLLADNLICDTCTSRLPKSNSQLKKNLPDFFRFPQG